MKPIIYKLVQSVGPILLLFILPLFYFPSLLQINNELNLIQGTALFCFSGSLAMIVSSDDMKSHWDKYCPVLPISRKTIVSTHFILLLLGNLIQLVLSGVLASIGAVQLGDGFSFVYIAKLIACYFTGSAFSGLVLFVMFKFSYKPAYGIWFFFYCFAGFLSGFSAAVLEDNPSAVSFITDGRAYLVCALICVALFALEWYGTIKLYGKKDL